MSDVKRPDIDAIKALAEKATAGPWHVNDLSDEQRIELYVHGPEYAQLPDTMAFSRMEDVRFIAAARTAVPQMAAYIEALESDIREQKGINDAQLPLVSAAMNIVVVAGTGGDMTAALNEIRRDWQYSVDKLKVLCDEDAAGDAR